MFKLEFLTDNAAFVDNDQEAANVVDCVLYQLRRGETDGICRDVNGNAIGQWSLDDE